MSKFLENLESKLQNLLEGTVDRLLSPGTSRTLSKQLLAMIDDKLREGSGQKGTVPDLINIYVSPEHLNAWQEARPTLDEVAKQIEISWIEEGYRFLSPLKISLTPTADLDVEEIEIKTGFSEVEVEQGTSPTALQVITRCLSPEALPKQACFIINGKEQVNLTGAVINVGRRTTSDLVIKDPLVSRDHLQLRAQGGRYTLFDLSSTGGTYINNQPIKSAMLKPGDVVRIGKTILIFNQELPQRSTSPTIFSLPTEEDL
ncbi:MAG: FHA domain-containing protein [Anaerolineaceae bacterium]